MVKKISALLSIADLAAAKPLAWPALYAILLAAGLTGYLPFDQANFWLGIVGVALYARYPNPEKAGYRFLFTTLIFLFLYLFLPVKTLLFFAFISALLFSLEAITGRLQAAIVPVIFLMSPVANYAAEVFSFPVRLKLSAWAAGFLQSTGHDAHAIGNTISFGGTLFDVDHACMGLSMLVSSLLIGLISIQLFEAKYHRRLPLPYLPLVLIYFTAFNVMANFIRITCLVYFHLAPGTVLHELMGLGCWILYGIVPSVVLVKAMVRHLGRYESVIPIVKFREPVFRFYQFTQLGLVVLLSLFFGLQPRSETNLNTGISLPVEGYEYQSLPHGVSSLKNETSLIYVKSIMGFYSTDHNPSICWRGSGFNFTSVRNAKRGEANIYLANLEKKDTTLYTAWWYESGTHRTNNQLVWRMKNLRKGYDYRLVNITASSQKDLEHAIEKWMKEGDVAVSLQP